MRRERRRGHEQRVAAAEPTRLVRLGRGAIAPAVGDRVSLKQDDRPFGRGPAGRRRRPRGGPPRPGARPPPPRAPPRRRVDPPPPADDGGGGKIRRPPPNPSTRAR